MLIKAKYKNMLNRDMRRPKKRKGSGILIQGVFKDSLFDLFRKQKVSEVVVLEGRPSLNALHTSSQQLLKRNITPVAIADNMAGFLFYKNLIKEVWISYHIADEDGALCDIGASIVGILGKKHRIPVFGFPANRRAAYLGRQKDLFTFNGRRVAPRRVKAYIPLMEWVPQKYITRMYDEI